MIYGIGVDIVQCSRMEGRSDGFFSRFLADEEMRVPISPQYAASRFAAKEAFSKAMGTGVRGFSMKDIAVLEDSLGKPYFMLKGNASAIAEGKKLLLSISHEKDYAVAMVVAEG